MNFGRVPTRANYDAWYQDRVERTMAVVNSGRKSITGIEVRSENLSLKVLYTNGYTLDSNDCMVKNG